MADDVGAGALHVDPAVPHDLVDEEAILRDAHGVDFAGAAVIFGAAVVGVGVGEDDVHSAAADAGCGARALAPVVIPPADVLDGVGVLVVVVGGGGLV
jgi:hypothetical protein